MRARIELLMNPHENRHKDLVRLLYRITENNKLYRNNQQSIQEITVTAQALLKEEWKRVKNGEPTYGGPAVSLLRSLFSVPYSTLSTSSSFICLNAPEFDNLTGKLWSAIFAS